jgi:uncharacterized protein DUF6456
MTRRAAKSLSAAAERALIALAGGSKDCATRKGAPLRTREADLAALIAADLMSRGAGGVLEVTSAGRAYLARLAAMRAPNGIDPYLAQHIDPAYRDANGPEGPARVLVDEAESPLTWLARRKGRDGRPLIDPEQAQAGERLREEFTRAQLMPHVTSNWSAATAQGSRGDSAADLTDAGVAARQRVRHALEAVGPEFAGLLIDVCCFLKSLEDVERERAWPPRSGKVVLQLGLDRLARHYGLQREARGRASAPVRAWLAADAFLEQG